MSTLNRDIARVVRTLLAHRGRSRAELASCLGVHVSAINKGLAGHRGWSAYEILEMAEFFAVPVTVFYETPDNLVISRWICPEPAFA